MRPMLCVFVNAKTSRFSFSVRGMVGGEGTGFQFHTFS